jgi:hypothetical protein
MDTGKTCNSQWAFIAAHTMESARAILLQDPATTHQVSVQQLIDCDQTDNGCVSGWPVRAYKWVANKGYVHINKYPFKYQSRRNMCQLMNRGDMTFFTSLRARQYLMIYPDMMKHFVRYQPVGVAINFPACVQNYKSGILSQAECPCSAETYQEVNIDALMIVVGYGQTVETDREYLLCSGYWILRATMGTTFGDQGHMRLCINRNRDLDNIGTCNMLVYPHFPDVGLVPPIA